MNKRLFFAPIIALIIGVFAVVGYGETNDTNNAAADTNATITTSTTNASDIKALLATDTTPQGITPTNNIASEPSWSVRVKEITLGMTRSEVEALLPTNRASGYGYNAGGRSCEHYNFDDGWSVSITYDMPETIKDGKRGWYYKRLPDDKVVEGPVLERMADSSIATNIMNSTANSSTNAVTNVPHPPPPP
jgi:hypothetical protein